MEHHLHVAHVACRSPDNRGQVIDVLYYELFKVRSEAYRKAPSLVQRKIVRGLQPEILRI